MKIQTSRKSFLSIESVAMTDIVMNLFIFFFISFSLLYTFNPQHESKIEVNLPEGKTSRQEARGEVPLEVIITSGNEIFVGKKRVLPEALKKELAQRTRQAGKAAILVRSDREASVNTLVRVLDTAKEVGIRKLGVAVEEARKF